MKIKTIRFHKDAVMPAKAYDKDFCYDLVAVSEEEIAPDVWKYGFGWGFQIERELEEIGGVIIGLDAIRLQYLDLRDSPLNLSIDIRPRSSIWKTGMVMSNSVGTVDEGYTNEISAIFYHVNKSLPRYRVGDRVAQMKIGLTFPCEFREVEELEETERGMNGYGSSGK